MSLTVRHITDDELVPWLDAVSTGFLDRGDTNAVAAEVRSLWDLDRVWAAFDGPRIAGTFRTWATELTVPGLARIGASAVTGVAVLPTHRRRGILSSMAGAEARAARDRGEVVALLHASEYPIYQRFGYGPATTAATWTLDARSAAFHSALVPGGSVELVATDDSGRDTAIAVFDAWRARQAGEIWRRPVMWSTDFGAGSVFGPPWKGFFVVHRDDAGAVDGYARYHVDGKWEERQPRAKLLLDELHALSDDAYAGLWQFLASIDWVSRIEADKRHLGERLPWLLTNARAAAIAEVGDGMWVKLLDIPRALEARAYERTAALVLEVIVRDGGADEATASPLRVALEASPDGVQARATHDEPDLTIDGAALGAAYLGGSRLRDAVLARGFDEHRAGALAKADALFATDPGPWTSTFF